MPYDPAVYHRRSHRLATYDYGMTGEYLVTICTQSRTPIFGALCKAKMSLNPCGQMIAEHLQAIPLRFPSWTIDTWVVMPDHVHIVLMSGDPAGSVGDPAGSVGDPAGSVGEPTGSVGDPAGSVGEPTGSVGDHKGRPYDARGRRVTLGEVVGCFKSVTTNAYIYGVKNHGWPSFDRRLWQRNYHDTIIRDQHHLDTVRHYIANNPANANP